MPGRGLYRIRVDDRGLAVLLNTAKLDFTPAQRAHLGLAIRDTAAKAQARAVRNVSGYPVQYDGKVFRVVVRTGALKGSIDMVWPFQSPFVARVFVNGSHTAAPFQQGDRQVKPVPVSQYAAAIEFGHKEIDLKQFMAGKTVPFFASRTSSSTGPFAVRGLTPATGVPGDAWENKALNKLLAHRGKKPMHFQRREARAYSSQKKGAGNYYIAFRKVGKTGWVIPQAQPRPFMRAASTSRAAQRDARSFTAQRIRELLADGPQPGQ